MLRERLLFHVNDSTTHKSRSNRPKRRLRPKHARTDAYRSFLAEELGRIRTHDREVLFHDDLSGVNQPASVSDRRITSEGIAVCARRLAGAIPSEDLQTRRCWLRCP